MSQQAGYIARLMRNGKVDEYDAWWVRGEDWRAAKKEADTWRMKAEANQRYLDEARGHLAVRTSLSVTLGEKVCDLESKLTAANLLVATLREQVAAIIWAQHHQLKDDIEEWRSAAASRSAQVRNLEKLLRDERDEHDEVVRKYSHKVDDLEELMNDERKEYEAVLGEKCSLLGKVESLKETVEELTGKVALLEEEKRVVVKPGENQGDNEENWIISREKIDEYFRQTLKVETGKKNYSEFRNKIYNDPGYIEWSNTYCSENSITVRKSRYTTHKVLAAGDSWWNWKVGTKKDTGCKDPEKHKFICESLHYVYKLYSRHKKQDEVNMKYKK